VGLSHEYGSMTIFEQVDYLVTLGADVLLKCLSKDIVIPKMHQMSSLDKL